MSGESQTVHNINYYGARKIGWGITIIAYFFPGGQGGSGGGGGIQGGRGGAGEGPAVSHHINVAGNLTMNSLYPEQPEGYHNSTERDKIIEWYSPLNFFPRQADIFAAREPGTGGWLLESDLFRNWKSGIGEILWCPGIPGAGKTVLVSIIVDHLRTAQDCPNIGVAVIYLNHKESDAHSPSSLLASLWRQFVLGKFISPAVWELHKKHREARTRPSVEEAHAVLCSIIPEYSRVFVLVDALDEYPEVQRHALLRCLFALGPTANLMLTSRPHIKFDHVTPNTRLAIQEIRATEEDIRKYLDRQILNSSSLSKHISKAADLREAIEEKIVQSSDGIFLLAKLHIDSLAITLTIKAVRDALRNMPSDLEHTYDEIVDRINRQPDEHKKIAWLALSWITNAKRPLNSSELRVALAVEPGAKELDPENLLDMDTILSVCIGLVVLNEGDDIIRLIHYTTQNYFERVQARLFPHAQTTITTTCITYLSFPVLFNSTNDWALCQQHSLLRYAVQYALIHARGQPELDIRDMILWFLVNCSAWRRLWDSGGRNSFRTGNMPGGDAHLGIAAFFGLEEIVQYLIKEDGSGSGLQHAVAERNANNVDLSEGSKREVYDWALWVATLAGHEIIVRLLLEHGANVNAEGRDFNLGQDFSVLWVASEKGHEAIVKLLIAHGADVNAENGWRAGALQAASEQGYPAIFKLLIQQGADINAKIKGQPSALQAASAQGHKAIVNLLIAHGADVNAENGLQESALGAASANGHKAIVKLLITHGADVNAENGLQGSALGAASANGHEAIVKLLIAHGADVNAKKGWQRALYVASEKGHEEIVKFLIEHGADVNAENGWRGSALRAASANRHEAIVKLLIEHGADVNAKVEGQPSALQIASEKGQEGIVKLLIAHGADVNAAESQEGALWAASVNGHEVIVKLLITHGADINAGGWQRGALRAASANGHEAIVELLIAYGAKGQQAASHEANDMFHGAESQQCPRKRRRTHAS
ncbi:ankyrin repeat-containing domain protein [Mycena epipterygia]|nr:ankyrin repeat-containing domain protein [Mycena epipterygia]